MDRSNNFDFIRLIFATFVIISHSYVLSGDTEGDFLYRITNGQTMLSHIGVSGFFVVSGYLVFQSLCRSLSVREYFIKRVRRIVPALFVMLCITLLMLHSGSRGVGNAIGTHFIELAKQDARLHQQNLPDENLAYFEEGARYFGEYVKAVGWAQKFAAANREVMMTRVINAMRKVIAKPFETHVEAVNCHHNYVQRETHFGQEVFVTRKGAVSAEKGRLGIIPGSMGAKSYIVRGKGRPDSFNSCSHGAGRTMSRTQAKKLFTEADQIRATEGVECRKDAGVIDEIPMAYKDIDAVMAAQADLVDVLHTLKQVVCVKG